MVAIRQVFLPGRPAKQGNDIFVVLVNESCNRAVLDHFDPSSDEGEPQSRQTDYRWSKIELCGQPRPYNLRIRRGDIDQMIRRKRVGMTQNCLARELFICIWK